MRENYDGGNTGDQSAIGSLAFAQLKKTCDTAINLHAALPFSMHDINLSGPRLGKACDKTIEGQRTSIIRPKEPFQATQAVVSINRVIDNFTRCMFG